MYAGGGWSARPGPNWRRPVLEEAILITQGGVGFDDQGILQITLMTAWFNYINRVADALGVGRGD